MKRDMAGILDMVKSGRLHEATSAIRARLSGHEPPGTPSGGADTTGSRPMKDVTPAPHALPSPDTAPGAQGPRQEPRPQRRARAPQKARWERHAGPVPYRLYRPAAPVATAPLIVMLHGCTQTPEDFAAGTRLNVAADRIGAHVIWPEQTRAANPNGCWNWFEPRDQGRSGAAEAIATLTLQVARDVAPDASGRHVAGLSAGGAMAAILGAHYPEVFASVGVHSGLPVGSAQDVGSAFSAMRSGGRGSVRIARPTIVFHGTADRTVHPENGRAVFRTASAQGQTVTRKVEGSGRSATVTTVTTDPTRAATELWEIDGLGHAWSGGSTEGSFADPDGPDSTQELIRFFQAVDAVSD